MTQGSEAERLAAEKQYFEAVLDSMCDGVLVCDSAMHVTKFNTAAEQITGWNRADAIGAPCPDIFHGFKCRAPRIGTEHLPPEIRSAPRAAHPGAGTLTRDTIEAALQKTGGNRLRAARALGVGRATFYREVAELGIDIPTKR